MKPAYAYLRVSGHEQTKRGGMDRQRDAIRRYAKQHRLRIAGWFEDSGVSGTMELARRDGLADLLAKLQADDVSIVLVEEADRLARDLIVQELTLNLFQKFGVQVIQAVDGQELTADPEDATRILIRQVLGAMAQFAKTQVVLRLRAGRQRVRRREGRCEGRKPYGFYEGEAVGLARMKVLRGRGFSVRKVAHLLNEAGFKSRNGKTWLPGTVAGILRRELGQDY